MDASMDDLLGAAIRGGVCVGAALAARAEAVERHPDDPRAALAALDLALLTLVARADGE